MLALCLLVLQPLTHTKLKLFHKGQIGKAKKLNAGLESSRTSIMVTVKKQQYWLREAVGWIRYQARGSCTRRLLVFKIGAI